MSTPDTDNRWNVQTVHVSGVSRQAMVFGAVWAAAIWVIFTIWASTVIFHSDGPPANPLIMAAILLPVALAACATWHFWKDNPSGLALRVVLGIVLLGMSIASFAGIIAYSNTAPTSGSTLMDCLDSPLEKESHPTLARWSSFGIFDPTVVALTDCNGVPRDGTDRRSPR